MSTQTRIDAFMAAELAELAPLFAERFGKKLQSLGKVASGELLRSMASRAVNNREIQAEFAQYGRFVDMGARGGWRKGVYIGQREAKEKPKKAVFYSRIKMGLYGQLVSNLSNKYVEAMYEEAKEGIQVANG
jgi:hypothetical protein